MLFGFRARPVVSNNPTRSESPRIPHETAMAAIVFLASFLAASQVRAQSQAITLSETSLSVDESNSATYTVKLATQPTGDVTVTITGTSGTDLDLDKTSLTFTTSTWSTVQTVRVTADGDTDATDDFVTLAHTASGADYASVTKELPVTVEDITNVTLTVTGLDLLSMSEYTDDTRTISARLSRSLSDDVTLTVTASPDDATTTSGDYTLSPDPAEITISAGDSLTSDEVVFTAVDDFNDRHKNVQLTLTVDNARVTVSGGTTRDIFIRSDDLASISLELAPDPIFENGRASRVTATMAYSDRVKEQVTLTISAEAASSTVAGDFTLTGGPLTFAPGAHTSQGTVMIAANDDADMDDETVTVTGKVTGGRSVIEPEPLTLNIVDDDETGLVTMSLRLTPERIRESGGFNVSTVTAEVSRPLTQPATVTVSASPNPENAETTADDYALSTNLELLIAAGETESKGRVTLTAVDNSLYEGTHKSVLVTGTVTGNAGVAAPPQRELTILEDDVKATVQLIATPQTIDEDGGVSTITAVSHLPMPETVTFDVRVSGSAVTLSDNVTLTLAQGETNSTGTVTVTAGDISGTNHTSVSISRQNLSSSSFTVKTTRILVIDDDYTGSQLWMRLSPGDMVEGQNQVSTVSAYLTQALSENVTVTVAIDEDYTSAFPDEYTLSTNRTLTISAGDTTSTGTVTLTSVDNDYYSARHGYRVGYTYEVTGPAGLQTRKLQDSWSIREDESPTVVTLVLTPDAIDENGGESTVTAELNSAVRSNLTLTVLADGSGDVTQNGTTLTIAEGSKTSTGTVTLTAVDNAMDALDKFVRVRGSLTVAEDLPFSIVFPYGRQLTITDDDEADLVLSTASLTVTEGADPGGTYTVKLATEPTSDVSVSIGLPSGTDVSVNPSSLTFTPTTWNTERTVTVSAAHDDDASNDSATLTHMATGGGYGSVSKDVSVTVNEDDEPALVLSGTSLTVAEGADPGETYTVKLDTKPTASVTVTIGGTADTDLTPDKTSLTFSTTNWNVEQTVTVSAAEDDDAVDDSATLTHTASGGDYGSVSKDLPVTVTDDDEAEIVLSPTSLGVVENQDAAYEVKLATKPTATVTVSITGHTGTDLTPDKTSLTFSTTNWNTEQTVTVSAGDDSDAAADEETLTHTAEGGDYGSVSKDLAVTVTDDDQAGIAISQPSLDVDEGDIYAYTVKLATQPTAPVTVSIGGHSDTDLILDRTSLTFSTTTWNTEQTVEVTAAHDDDASNDSATLTHTASGGDYGSVSKDLPVTVTDDDEVDIVLFPESLDVLEDGSSTYTVRLATEPTAGVTVTIGGHTGTDLTLDTTELTFTPTGWNAAQTVRVSAGDDDDGGSESATLTHTATGGDYAFVTRDLPVTITDDDAAGLVLSPSSLNVEEGTDVSYTVRLATEPTDAVTVTIGGTSGTDLILDRTSLTFSTSAWSTEQTVQVTVAADEDGRNDLATLTHTASGGDYGSVSRDLRVLVSDGDDEALVLSRGSLTVEEGTMATYTVKLATMPLGNVEVNVAVTGETDVSVNPTRLTFTPSDWATWQTVRVSAAHDDDALDDQETATHSASGAGYGSVSKALTVVVADDDEPDLVFLPTSLTVGEGTDATYRVNLATEPSSDVTVTIGGGREADLTLETNSLTFARWNWYAAQTVKVSAGHDDDTVNDRGTLTHSAAGGDYGSVRKRLPVVVTDDDAGGGGGGGRGGAPAAIVISPSSLTVDEGAHAAYSVALAAQPTSDVTVTIGGAGGTDLSLDRTDLTFSTTAWNTPQSVRVSAAHDDDAVNDTVTLTHNGSGGGYGSVSRDLGVTVRDDDEEIQQTVEVTVYFDRETHTAVEGGSPARVTVRVMLNVDPDRVLTVPLAVTLNGGATGDDYEGVPEEVTFGRGEMEKAFHVTAIDDDVDDDDESLTIGFGALPDGALAGRPVSTLVHLQDNDDPVTTVSFDRSTYEAAEGGSPARVTVRVMLNRDPERELTVPLSVTPNGGATTEDYEGVPEYVTFGTGEMEKAFEVTAVDDDVDDDDESLTIGFGALPERVRAGDPASALVNLLDNDDPVTAVSFGKSTYETEEGGSPARVAVLLSVDPEREVTIPITATPGNGAARVDYNGLPPGVTFNPGETEMSFELTAADDDYDDDDEDLTLGFGALPPRVEAGLHTTALVTIIDNDERGVTVSAADLAVPEGGAGTYSLVLHSAPTAPVTVAVTGMAGTDVSVEQPRLTFSPDGWDTPQEVVVRALDDADAVVDVVTLQHTISGGDYDGEVVPGVSVTVIEDDVPAASVGDRQGAEHAGELVFTVALDIPSSKDVTVRYATASGTALSSADFTATQGILRFAALETRQAIRVPITDDNVEEDTETFTVMLAEPENATLNAGRKAATGTIEDNDAAIRALEIFLSSVGRMVASDAIEVISRRFDQRAGMRPRFTVHGTPLAPRAHNGADAQRRGARPERIVPTTHGVPVWIPAEALASQQYGLSLRVPHLRPITVWDVLSRSDFELPMKNSKNAGGWTLWGRGALGGFSGVPTAIRRMEADAFSSYVGIDYNVRAKALLGLALTHSLGDLSYSAANSARTIVPIDFGITTVLPYLHLRLHPRFGTWGLSGIGRGTVEMSDAHGAYDTEVTLLMGAGGARQNLVSRGHFEFALKGDAFYVQTESDPSARLPSVKEEAKRVRVLIEGSRTYNVGRASRMSQSLEIGGRWDRGRLEDGRGVDVGGGIDYGHTQRGVSLAARGRYLLVHEQEGYEEWGASLILRINPGSGRRGLVMDVSPVWGMPTNTTGELWPDAYELAFSGAGDPGARPDRIEVDVGYQFLTYAGEGLITPYAGWSAGSRGSQRYRIGGRMRVGRDLSVNVQGRRDTRQTGDATHGVRILGHVYW